MKKIFIFVFLTIIGCINAMAATDAGGAQPQAFNMDTVLLLVVFIAVFYFLMIRPQMKRSKEHRMLLSSLNKGDEVTTNSGIVGKVTKVSEQFVEVEVADKVVIKMQKQAVTNVLPKGSIKDE